MSRIGNQFITIPDGVELIIKGQEIIIKGNKGELKHICNDLISLDYNKEEKKLFVKRDNETRQASALHGLNRSLIANMIIGVSAGWVKKLEIVGTGYRSQVSNNKLNLTLGYSHPINFEIPVGISITVTDNTNIEISGFDKQLVGQTAANVRSWRKPDAYKGKGVRYAGEKIVLKEGKSASK